MSSQKKLLWGPGIIVRFLIRIRNRSRLNADQNQNRTGSAAIFRIRLFEIMTALHRVYLEVNLKLLSNFIIMYYKFFLFSIQPEGPIYTSLMEFIKNPNDMTVLFNPSNPIYESCVNATCQSLEEIVTHITEFMVIVFFSFILSIVFSKTFLNSRKKESSVRQASQRFCH